MKFSQIQFKNSDSKLFGTIIVLANLYWIWSFVDLYNLYKTNILIIIMYPDWVMFMNMISGGIGAVIGVYTFKGSIPVGRGLLYSISLWGIITLISNLSITF